MALESTENAEASWVTRLRRGVLFVLFAAVLMIPKALGLRRRRALWNAGRVAAALAGAVLVLAPQGSSRVWFGLPLGLVLLLLSLVVPAAREERSVDECARELGAVVVVSGGWFEAAGYAPVESRVFVCPERVCVLDRKQRPLAEIPLVALRSIDVYPAGDGWSVRMESPGAAAEFHYHGFFAEHLARVAATTVRSQLRLYCPRPCGEGAISSGRRPERNLSAP